MNNERYIAFAGHQATMVASVLDAAGREVNANIRPISAQPILSFMEGLRGKLQVIFEEEPTPHRRAICFSTQSRKHARERKRCLTSKLRFRGSGRGLDGSKASVTGDRGSIHQATRFAGEVRF